MPTECVSFLPSATKLRQGNVFTPVCQSVHRGGGYLPQCMLEYTPWVDTRLRQTPPRQTHTPGQTPPWADLPADIPQADTPPFGDPLADTPGRLPLGRHHP